MNTITNLTRTSTSLVVLYGLIVICLTVIAWLPLHTHVAPSSDIAADMLLTNQLRDEGWLLVGRYSRFQVNHPGPFWFYYNRLFELIFARTDFSRFQIWLIASIVINSLLILFSANALSLYFHEGFDFYYSAMFVIIVLGFTSWQSIDLWMPNRHIVPYMAFIICILHIVCGNYKYFAASVLLASILIHSYAMMPVFTLPFLVAGAIIGYATKPPTLCSKTIRWQLFLAIGIGLAFATPLLIDAFHSEVSNISKLLATQFSFANGPKPNWQEMNTFANDLIFRSNSIGWVISLILMFMGLTMVDIDYGLRKKMFAPFLLCLLVTAATFFFFKRTPPPIYPYVASFYLSIPILLVSTILSPFFGSYHSGGIRLFGNPHVQCGAQIALVLTVMLFFCYPLRRVDRPDDGQEIKVVATYLQAKSNGAKIAIDYAEHDQWPFIAGLLLELDQRNLAACTTWRHMAFLYTKKEVCEENTVPTVRITKSADSDEDCLLKVGQIGVTRFDLNKFAINLGDPVGFSSNKLSFENWWVAEENWRWSVGKVSNVIFYLSDPELAEARGEIVIRGGSLGSQRVRIGLNHREVFAGEIDSSDKTITIAFAPSLLKNANVLRFNFPDARQPDNGDPRVLAFSLRSLTIR